MDDKKTKKPEPASAKATDGQGKKDPSAGSGQSEVAPLKLKIEELENQVKHIFADYQNLQKRVDSERREWLIKANKDLILRFLPALDFLLLSSKHIKDEGLTLSLQKFFDILKTEGVEKIETVGKEFDPSTMEGITTVPGEENKVIEEFRVGYRMGDQVLRPAQVSVGKPTEVKS